MQIKLKKPTYGDLSLPVEEKETVKAVLLSLSGRNVTDESYYDGYISYARGGGKKYKKAQISFKDDSLFIDDVNIKCNISDPELISIRVQQYQNEFMILFDFYVEGHGYSKKCVKLAFNGSIPWEVETEGDNNGDAATHKNELFLDDKGVRIINESVFTGKPTEVNNTDQLVLF